MVGMLQRTLGRLGSVNATAPFLPLSFRFFAAFGLLAVHAALPQELRASGAGEQLYLAALGGMFLEAAWESGRGLLATGQLFPTPSRPWIWWNLFLDLLLVSLVIAFQGVWQERFATLYTFPVLASAFYLGTTEIVWVGVASSLTHVLVVLGFSAGLLPPFGLSGEAFASDPGGLSFLLGIASLQVFATTLVVVLIRRNLESLRTDLSVSEAAVDQLSALHQRVVQSMNSGLITLDLEGRVTSANPAAEAILGRSIPLGASIHGLLSLGNPIPLPRGREHRFELAHDHPVLGRRLLGGHLASLRDGAGQDSGELLLFQDLTDLKALEERTRISERLAAVGQMAAGLAHELRNPLASISGCVQLLRRDGPPEGVPSRVLGILDRETQRLGVIVSDFLDLARPNSRGGEPLFLPKVVEELRASWEMDPRNGQLSLQVDAIPPVWIQSDPTGLHRSVMNLLSNARKAVKGVASPAVAIHLHRMGRSLQLTVADNGCGMHPEQLDRLFVPFAGSFEEGSGLGMSLVYTFVDSMGWEMRVESEPGQGTRVHLLIPLLEGDPALAPTPNLA